jgi:type I site-specific restriction endonuclease
MKGEADLVLWDVYTSSYERKAFAVIEAKAPNRPLDEFQAQVRSYAFSLDAPIYVITNGKDFQVFRRGVQKDICVINCAVSSLANNWSLIEQTISANARNG